MQVPPHNPGGELILSTARAPVPATLIQGMLFGKTLACETGAQLVAWVKPLERGDLAYLVGPVPLLPLA